MPVEIVIITSYLWTMYWMDTLQESDRARTISLGFTKELRLFHLWGRDHYINFSNNKTLM